jgi:hypothetical protein
MRPSVPNRLSPPADKLDALRRLLWLGPVTTLVFEDICSVYAVGVADVTDRPEVSYDVTDQVLALIQAGLVRVVTDELDFWCEPVTSGQGVA